MFSYILKIHAPADAQTDEFFERFKKTPGLLHAYDLQGVDDPDDGVVVTIWDSRKSAEAYLQESSLRKEVDVAFPEVARTMYEVRNSK
jgi:heme-degrading monooxygenase HmoA